MSTRGTWVIRCRLGCLGRNGLFSLLLACGVCFLGVAVCKINRQSGPIRHYLSITSQLYPALFSAVSANDASQFRSTRKCLDINRPRARFAAWSGSPSAACFLLSVGKTGFYEHICMWVIRGGVVIVWYLESGRKRFVCLQVQNVLLSRYNDLICK